jgi:hypothetical protein
MRRCWDTAYRRIWPRALHLPTRQETPNGSKIWHYYYNVKLLKRKSPRPQGRHRSATACMKPILSARPAVDEICCWTCLPSWLPYMKSRAKELLSLDSAPFGSLQLERNCSDRYTGFARVFLVAWSCMCTALNCSFEITWRARKRPARLKHQRKLPCGVFSLCNLADGGIYILRWKDKQVLRFCVVVK